MSDKNNRTQAGLLSLCKPRSDYTSCVCKYLLAYYNYIHLYYIWSVLIKGVHDSHDRDRMVVGFTTTCAISAYHHWCEFESRSGRCVHYVIKVCQWLVTGRWFYPGPSTNKTVRQNIIEILLKVALPCDHGSCKPMYETNKM